MTRTLPDRLLVIDVRPTRFGYAAFEAPVRLLDCGVRRFRSTSKHVRISDLLETFQPSIVVLRMWSAHGRRNSPRLAEVMRAVRGEVRRVFIPIAFVSEKTVARFFGRYGKKSKHEIASLLATWFPALEWKLPPRRKIWQAEHWRMPIFDAVALGITYLAGVDFETVRNQITSA